MKYLSLLFFLFAGTSVLAQIPAGYYDNANGLSGSVLKAALHDIIKDHKEFTYTGTSTDTWDILKETGRDTANLENVILLYSGWSVNAAQEYNSASGWSREHVWAKSHGDFGTSKGAGTDVHHLCPADISVNSARNNKDFDNGGTVYVDGDGVTTCKSDADSWEARDVIKGDVARMLFYMAVRYEGEGGEPDLELVDAVNTVDLNEAGKGYHGKLSALLEWHESDPVDSLEIKRNNVIYSFQENRNPFIDHPEYVVAIWENITAVEYLKSSELKIYPNPASDYLHVVLPDDEEGTGVLYSMTGVKVMEFSGRGHLKLQIDNVDSGCYGIRIVSNKKVYQSKVVVQD
jgi:endonuclease I